MAGRVAPGPVAARLRETHWIKRRARRKGRSAFRLAMTGQAMAIVIRCIHPSPEARRGSGRPRCPARLRCRGDLVSKGRRTVWSLNPVSSSIDRKYLLGLISGPSGEVTPTQRTTSQRAGSDESHSNPARLSCSTLNLSLPQKQPNFHLEKWVTSFDWTIGLLIMAACASSNSICFPQLAFTRIVRHHRGSNSAQPPRLLTIKR